MTFSHGRLTGETARQTHITTHMDTRSSQRLTITTVSETGTHQSGTHPEN